VEVFVLEEIQTVNRFSRIAFWSIAALLLMATPALAADGVEFSGAIGAGLVCIGSAYGIGKLAGSAVESMSRQPEVAGTIQVAMIIAAALIEGFTFFALYVCMIQNPWAQ
jgi:F-type H+-transporting ATPase subunit c